MISSNAWRRALPDSSCSRSRSSCWRSRARSSKRSRTSCRSRQSVSRQRAWAARLTFPAPPRIACAVAAPVAGRAAGVVRRNRDGAAHVHGMLGPVVALLQRHVHRLLGLAAAMEEPVVVLELDPGGG